MYLFCSYFPSSMIDYLLRKSVIELLLLNIIKMSLKATVSCLFECTGDWRFYCTAFL